jgi:ABC-2 type transport system permease protein
MSMQLSITVVGIGLAGLSVVCGLLVFLAVEVFFCSIVIVAIQADSLAAVLYHFQKFAHFPLQVFPNVLQIILVTVLPLAAMAYAPSQSLLGRIDLKIMVSFAASILFFSASLVAWRQALKHYTSAGG